MDTPLLEIYNDFLINSFSQTTATGLSKLFYNEISYDKVTKFLSKSDYSSKDLWLLVKPTMRSALSKDICYSFFKISLTLFLYYSTLLYFEAYSSNLSELEITYSFLIMYTEPKSKQ